MGTKRKSVTCKGNGLGGPCLRRPSMYPPIENIADPFFSISTLKSATSESANLYRIRVSHSLWRHMALIAHLGSSVRSSYFLPFFSRSSSLAQMANLQVSLSRCREVAKCVRDQWHAEPRRAFLERRAKYQSQEYATAYNSELKHVRSLPVADHLTPGMLDVVVYSWSSDETVTVIERCGEMVCPRRFQRHPRDSCSRCRRDNSIYLYPYSLTPEVTCHWRPETHTSPLQRLSHPIMESLHGIDSARRMALLSINTLATDPGRYN